MKNFSRSSQVAVERVKKRSPLPKQGIDLARFHQSKEGSLKATLKIISEGTVHNLSIAVRSCAIENVRFFSTCNFFLFGHVIVCRRRGSGCRIGYLVPKKAKRSADLLTNDSFQV